MNIIKKLSSVFFIIICTSNIVWAKPYFTANQLLNLCKIYPDGCQAYFDGFLHGLMIGADLDIPVKKRNVSAETLLRIFMQEMNKNPQNGDGDAGTLIANKLIELNMAKLRNNN